MKRAISYITLTWQITKINILSQMEYRGAFLSQVLGMFFNDIGLIVIWVVFFHQFNTLRGWTLSQTILLFSISSFNLGLVRVIAGGCEEISAKILKGELDYFLTLPRNLLWQMSLSETKIFALGDMLFALALLFIFVHPSLTQILIYFLMTTLSALIIFNFILAVNSIGFFVGDFEENSTRIVTIMLMFCLYPQTAFSGLLRDLTITVFPAIAIAWIPVSLFSSFNWHSVAIVLVYWVASFVISQALFNYGLKHYESGNLINVRM